MEDRKEQLLVELREKFEKEKKRLGFKASYEDLNEIFFFENAVLREGFVSEDFSRFLCGTIVDNFGGWNNYLHNLIMPNPGHMLNITEAKAVSEDNKKKISKIISESMLLISRNTIVGLTKDEEGESDFIDDSLEYCKTKYKKVILEVLGDVKKGWEEMSKKDFSQGNKRERIGFG